MKHGRGVRARPPWPKISRPRKFSVGLKVSGAKRRRGLFIRQDEIQVKRDGLIEELDNQLRHQHELAALFATNWRLE